MHGQTSYSTAGISQNSASDFCQDEEEEKEAAQNFQESRIPERNITYNCIYFRSVTGTGRSQGRTKASVALLCALAPMRLLSGLSCCLVASA